MIRTNRKSRLAYNLATLRKQQRLTLEQVAERIGVTRQAVAKWETGESMPDLINCDALATLYNVSLDDLVHFDQEATGIGVPPKDKHLFGTVQIGERGQIVIPKKGAGAAGLQTWRYARCSRRYNARRKRTGADGQRRFSERCAVGH